MQTDAEVAAIAVQFNERQRDILLNKPRILTTEHALTLPMVGLVERAGGFNRWRRTALAARVAQHLKQENAK